MQFERDPAAPPLSMWLRTFLKHPHGVDDRSFAELSDEIRDASIAGMDHVIIDPSFSAMVNTPGGWLRVIEELAPAVTATTG